MRDQNINVIMISQASSEHSVCFAVKTADTEKALAALNKRWVCGRTAARLGFCCPRILQWRAHGLLSASWHPTRAPSKARAAALCPAAALA